MCSGMLASSKGLSLQGNHRNHPRMTPTRLIGLSIPSTSSIVTRSLHGLEIDSVSRCRSGRGVRWPPAASGAATLSQSLTVERSTMPFWYPDRIIRTYTFEIFYVPCRLAGEMDGGDITLGAFPKKNIMVSTSLEIMLTLVGGLEHVLFFHILGMSSSQLTFIFVRGVQTTNQ